MKEILGHNLKQFFDTIDPECKHADITYAGSEYEVWEVFDELFLQMCDMTEEKFIELAGEDAWWRSSEGSVLGYPDETTIVNGNELVCWGKERIFPSNDYVSPEMKKHKTLTEYLHDCVGVSQPRNVCACVMDLAKYNDMTMSELFKKYEGGAK